jgi:hypothetical protein
MARKYVRESPKGPLFLGVEFRLAASYQTRVESVLSTLSFYPPSWPRFAQILGASQNSLFQDEIQGSSRNPWGLES